VHELLGAPREVAVRVPVDPTGFLADDLDLAKMIRGILKQEPRRELHRHHRNTPPVMMVAQNL
jgi:hypothetical protein